MPSALPTPPEEDTAYWHAYWRLLNAEGRPADTALADVESPWAPAPVVSDEDPDPGYIASLMQGPVLAGATLPVVPDEDPGYGHDHWHRINTAGRPADTALADVEGPWSRVTIPDPGDPEPGYWNWLYQSAPPTLVSSAEGDDTALAAGQATLDDPELAYWEERIYGDDAAVTDEPAPAPTVAPDDNPWAQPGDRSPLAPPNPAVLAYLRGAADPGAVDVPAPALNPQQRAAVEHPPGPVMVTAGPGTGKTRVLAQRVVHLVRSGGAAPETVLAVTFTRQAAREMQARLAEALPHGAGEGITVCTFHALGLDLLRTEAGGLDLGLQPRFSVYGNGQGDAVLRRALQQAGAAERYWPLDQVRGHIARAKAQLRTPEELLAQAREPRAQTLARIYQAYQEGLQAANAVDYD
ncbi:MAG: UvrD-helicase domain-containing protein, partial [Chloroflexi bacterium]|nr:UvrD-helicase domain-containing protein [Chloroflexota bacterium]